jgi:glycine betaine/proline transport system ATP-binding protein
MVFQQFGLLPWRSVAENVGLGLELRGMAAAERRRVVAEQLELVGLAQWADRSVGELSGGMQQRVGLARAFATNADILLMDEPFSALDPLIRDKLQDELLALQARVRKTILFVSHDLDEALRLGDRISIMRHGRIVQTGTAQDIVLRPADDYVAEFVRRMNPLKVLNGEMVMRARPQLACADGELFLDAARRYRLRLDADGLPASLSIDGAAHPLRVVDDEAQCAEDERSVVVAPASITLQGLIHLRRRTGHPVVLAEGGQVLGVAGDAEIIAALSARNQGATTA